MDKDPFKEYIKQSEPNKETKVTPGIQLSDFKQWMD